MKNRSAFSVRVELSNNDIGQVLAFYENAKIGEINFSRESRYRNCEIGFLGVNKKYRGRHVAQRMLQELVNFLRKNCKEIKTISGNSMSRRSLNVVNSVLGEPKYLGDYDNSFSVPQAMKRLPPNVKETGEGDYQWGYGVYRNHDIPRQFGKKRMIPMKSQDEQLELFNQAKIIRTEALKLSMSVNSTDPRYPSLAWVRSQLYYGYPARIDRKRNKILAAYVIGSEAKGTANEESDLDIAVVLPQKPRRDALDFTERYHDKFQNNEQMPMWNGRRVDFQFFYPNDPALAGYARIPLK